MPTVGGPRRPPVVPGYVVEDLLGRGGSGEVWRARPRAGGPAVAVKVLVSGDPARQAREAALLGELDHPHLVRLHEVVRRSVPGAPDQVSLVLDLLAGGSLASLLARRGRLRPGEVITAIAPVAAALAHAHERGVVHGDLSPGNIVFTAEGRPVLTDLGVARVLGDAARAEVTPAYVDPTVARGGAPGPASDVFGVAAAAFHALTGVAPWNAAGPAETLRIAAEGELPDLDLLAPEAPLELRDVIRRGLSAQPHLRGSAAAFALDLRHSARPEPVRLPVTGVPDEELGLTGRGPRTELTHLVPGRRPGGVHAAPTRPPRWKALWSRRAIRAPAGEPLSVATLLLALSRRLAIVLAVVAAVVAAVWLGARWGGGAADAGATPVPAVAAATGDPHRSGARPRDPADPDAPATPVTPRTGAPTPTGVPAVTPTRVPAVTPQDTSPAAAPESRAPLEPPGADVDPAVGDRAGWQRLLSTLYANRVAAFLTVDPARLDAVYAPGSALRARDLTQLQQLRSDGERLDGFAPAVVRVEAASVDGDRAEIVLVDVFPAYRVLARAAETGSPVREVPGRGEQRVTAELVRGAAGWALADAHRMAP